VAAFRREDRRVEEASPFQRVEEDGAWQVMYHWVDRQNYRDVDPVEEAVVDHFDLASDHLVLEEAYRDPSSVVALQTAEGYTHCRRAVEQRRTCRGMVAEDRAYRVVVVHAIVQGAA
jgi:hypothetical protein